MTTQAVGAHTAKAGWTHSICERCWFDGPGKLDTPDTYRVPTMVDTVRGAVLELVDEFEDAREHEVPLQRIRDAVAEGDELAGLGQCCFCGGVRITQIYVREDPSSDKLTGCHGVHRGDQ